MQAMSQGRRLEPGEGGSITITRLTSGRFQASTYWRPTAGGKPRRIRRVGGSASAATAALERACVSNDMETLPDLLNAWLEAHTGITQATRERYGREISRYLSQDETGGGVRLAEISRTSAQGVISAIAHEHSRAAARRARTCLTQALRWASSEGILPADYGVGLKTPGRSEPTRPKVPEVDRLTALVELLEADLASGRSGIKDRSALLAAQICLGTGARIGEVCALNWEDIDIGRAVITFRATMAEEGGQWIRRDHLKNGDPYRVCHISDTLAATLAGVRQTSGPVIVGRGGVRRNPRSLRQSWLRVYRAAGIPDDQRVTPHAIRRAVGARIAETLGIEESAGQMGNTMAIAERHYVGKRLEGPSLARTVLTY